jgi:peptidoglycan-binding protein ArfA
VAAVAVPLLLALIGWGAAHRSERNADVAAPPAPPAATSAASSTAQAASAAAHFGAMSITRTGNGFSLAGEVPDQGLKTMLPDSIRQAMPGAVIADDLTVKPGVTAPDFGGLGGLFGAAVDIRGFRADLVGDTVTLTGTASSAEDKAAAESSAKATWPKALLVNDIQVTGASASSPPPAPVAGGSCKANVSALLKTSITFDTNGSALGSNTQRQLAQIAATAKACPAAKFTVTGFTDDTGTDAINVPLSTSRAEAVANALVSDGITASSVTTSGAGAAHPVADNGTPAGRAQNRRVEIAVG